MNVDVTTATTAQMKADVFRLLAVFFYEPEKDLYIEEQVIENLAGAVTEHFPEVAPVAQALMTALHTSDQKDLLLDYARLFLGPFEPLAYPYGSIYLDGQKQVMGDSTLAAKEYYARHGVELDESLTVLPDHIAIELEFLYLLCFREEQALEAEDHPAHANTVDARRNFSDQHLGRWISAFASRVKQHADTDFYRLLAALCEHCVLTQKTIATH